MNSGTSTQLCRWMSADKCEQGQTKAKLVLSAQPSGVNEQGQLGTTALEWMGTAQMVGQAWMKVGEHDERVQVTSSGGNRWENRWMWLQVVEKTGGNIYLDIGCDYWVWGIWYQGWHSHRCPPLKIRNGQSCFCVCPHTTRLESQENKRRMVEIVGMGSSRVISSL